MTEKLIEKFLPMLLAGLGLDPVQTQAQLIALQNWVVGSIRNLDARWRAVEEDRAVMHAKLDRILNLLERDENGTAASSADEPLRIEHTGVNGFDRSHDGR